MSSKKLYRFLVITITVLTIVLLYQIAEKNRVRFDLTEENRFSVSPASKAILKNLNEPIFVEVYLDGKLPAQFERFKKSIGELLDIFSLYADVQFNFVDPSAATNQEARNRYYRSLAEKGIQPTNLNYREGDESFQKLIFPGAVVSVGVNEVPVNLLSGNKTSSKEEVINESIEGLEYAFINAIQSLTERKKRVGIVLGHGEPDSLQLAGLVNEVAQNFSVFKVDLPNRTEPISGYDALIIAKPTRKFSEREKYNLDQYVMNGGNLLVFYDALRVNMDSASGEGTVAVPYDTNLDDLLFRYGVRINKNYVLDINSGTFPVVTGNFGDQPQIQQLPWPFFPVITYYGDHPSVKGMDAVLMRFASEIDTVKAVGVTKTPLLQTTERSKVIGPPVKVAFNDLRGALQPQYFEEGQKNVGYLLEGTFTSLYKNRFLPRGIDKASFKSDGKAAKIVVISDGDIIRNEMDLETGNPLALGIDPYAQVNYSNGELVTRLLNFLTDDDGLIMIRSKEIKIRPLDKVQVAEERTKWQVINVVLPLLFIALLGVLKFFIRKRRFTKG